MKYLFVFLVPLTGCAHQTIHDYCTKNADHYSSYDECYAERDQKAKNKQNAFSHVGDGLMRPKPRRPAGY